MDAYLGIDVGTTQIKVVALAQDMRRRVARAPTPVDRDGAGPVHEPGAVVASVRALAAEAMAALPGAQVRACTVSSVGEEGLALDGQGQPLYPALAWYGRRHSVTGARFRADHDPAATYATCGLPQDAIHTLFQWAWLADHVPSAVAAMRRWLSLSEYVAFVLCGVPAMSPSQASRTHLWSPYASDWQRDWAQEVGVDPAVLPAVVPAGAVLGPLRTGALPDVPCHPEACVAVGGQDHAVGAWAAGVRAPGVVLDSLGTAESLYALSVPGARPSAAGRAAALQHGASVFPGPSAPLYVQAALHSGAGLAALARLVGRPLGALEKVAAAVPAGAGGMRYRAPVWGDDPRGDLLGMPLEADAPTLLRAVLEGWARAAKASLASVAAETGAAVTRVRTIGGGAGLGLGMTIRASMLPFALEVVEEPELVALGAALLARHAVEPDAPDLALAVRSVEPVPAWQEAYAAEEAAAAALVKAPRSDGPDARG